MTSLSREYIISFFPILYTNYNLNDNNNIELDPFVAMMRNNNEVMSQKESVDDLIPPKKPLVVETKLVKGKGTTENKGDKEAVDYYDQSFYDIFCKPKQTITDYR
jgi:hypothetical protein